jgi:hypothetical protein
MKRAFTLAAALCVLALGTVSTASAKATYSTTCPAYSQLVASTTYLVTGDPVTGADPSNVWATADYTRTLQIYKVPATKNTYCALWRDLGTFTTTGGTSPAGSHTVEAGITGKLTRSRVEMFTGTWRPPTGPIGPFDGPVDVLTLYFTDVSGVTVTWYADVYITPLNGSWGSRSGFPSYCDIVSS